MYENPINVNCPESRDRMVMVPGTGCEAFVFWMKREKPNELSGAAEASHQFDDARM